MKNFILLFLIFVSTNLFSQEKPGWTEMEIFMMTTGLSPEETIRYKFEAIGKVWRYEIANPPTGYEFSNWHNLAYYPILTQPGTGNTNFNDIFSIWGYNWMIPFQTYNHNADSIANGLYKVSIEYGDQYFYLDYRDDRYSSTSIYETAAGGVDIWILYNKNENKFMYRKEGILDPNPNFWNQITKGSHLGIWDIKEVGKPTTGNFPDFWENCLAVVNSGNGNPRLVWGPNPDFENISGYKIYRAVHWVPNPNPIVYSLIETVEDETFDYKDIQILLSQNGDYVWYYVIAYNSQTQSSPSNVVTTRASFYKTNNFDYASSMGYGLSQNFPNPFNPRTNISFSIAEKGFVKLVIYDLLGTELASLVNEIKEAGNYSVKFNAEKLPSGIYLYKIESGKFQETRKMILLK